MDQSRGALVSGGHVELGGDGDALAGPDVQMKALRAVLAAAEALRVVRAESLAGLRGIGVALGQDGVDGRFRGAAIGGCLLGVVHGRDITRE